MLTFGTDDGRVVVTGDLARFDRLENCGEVGLLGAGEFVAPVDDNDPVFDGQGEGIFYCGIASPRDYNCFAFVCLRVIQSVLDERQILAANAQLAWISL